MRHRTRRRHRFPSKWRSSLASKSFSLRGVLPVSQVSQIFLVRPIGILQHSQTTTFDILRGLIFRQLQCSQLSAQILEVRPPVCIEEAAVERSADRTTRLAVVLAVSEPAVLGEVFDVVEDRAEPLIRVDQAHFAYARRVED